MSSPVWITPDDDDDEILTDAPRLNGQWTTQVRKWQAGKTEGYLVAKRLGRGSRRPELQFFAAFSVRDAPFGSASGLQARDPDKMKELPRLHCVEVPLNRDALQRPLQRPKDPTSASFLPHAARSKESSKQWLAKAICDVNQCQPEHIAAVGVVTRCVCSSGHPLHPLPRLLRL